MAVTDNTGVNYVISHQNSIHLFRVIIMHFFTKQSLIVFLKFCVNVITTLKL